MDQAPTGGPPRSQWPSPHGLAASDEAQAAVQAAADRLARARQSMDGARAARARAQEQVERQQRRLGGLPVGEDRDPTPTTPATAGSTTPSAVVAAAVLAPVVSRREAPSPSPAGPAARPTPAPQRPTPRPAPAAATAPPVAPVPAAAKTAGAPATDHGSRNRLLLFVAAVVITVIALGLIRMDRDTPPDAVADAPTAAVQQGPPAGELRVEAVVEEAAIQVSEETRYTADPPTSVTLEVADLTGLDGPVGAAQLSVADLAVRVDGDLVQPEQDPARPGTWRVEAPGQTPFSLLEITYRLDGALVTSPLSAPGRALAVLRPLSAGSSVGSAAVSVGGQGIINVYCPGQTPDLLLCATDSGNGWDAVLPSPSPVEPVLLVQVDRG